MRFFQRCWRVATSFAATLATVWAWAALAQQGHDAGSSSTPASLPAASQPQALDEIVVTADFRDAKIADLPASVSVIDSEQLRATTVEHFEEAIREVPNLNLSGEGSRARYFQLRGVGELEQYDGAPNPSLGFIVDDIDFSGLGSIGTLYDVDRVEVLRGPQGTRYGANALGGLIYIRSADPTPELSADFKADGGSDDLRAFGAAVGGPLGDKAGLPRLAARIPRGRLSAQRVSESRRHVRPRRARLPRQSRTGSRATACPSISRASTSTSTTVTTRGRSTTASTRIPTSPARTRSARPRARSACRRSSTRSTS